MINNTISKRYAKALVQLGSESGQIDGFRKELVAVNGLFGASVELRTLFVNPAFTVEQKKQIMSDLLSKIGCSELVANFLLLLVDKGRISLVGQIVQTYEELADDFSGVIRPGIKTAFPLDGEQLSSIVKTLGKSTGKTVKPQVAVDPGLLGGVVVQIGDLVYDSSVKTQLNRIQDILQKG